MKHLAITSCRYIFCFLILLIANTENIASHLLGGHITYSRDSITANPRRVFFKLTTFTDVGRTNADNPTATLYLGDGIQLTANRASKTLITNEISRNVYYFEYSFPGPGIFTATFVEQNRTAGIINIPNAIARSFCITSQVTVDPSLGRINSPKPLLPPIFNVNVSSAGPRLTYNMAVYDADGDSLGYQLVPAMYNTNVIPNGLVTPNTIPDYTIPSFVSINPRTGELTFNNNGVQGTYNLAIKITKFRRKIAIGVITVDFSFQYRMTTSALTPTLLVTNRSEIPINSRDEINLTTNQPLRILVQLTDAQADLVQLSSRSELLVNNKATFSQSGAGNNLVGEFLFTPDITFKRNYPYLVVFTGISKKGDESVRRSLTIPIFVEAKAPTGLRDAKDISFVTGYPNPADHFITISHAFVKTNHELVVYNALGQVVQKKKLSPSVSTTLARQDILQSGQYFYTISDGVAVKQTGRFVFR